MVSQLLEATRKADVDICFESREEVVFDTSRPIHHPDAKKQYYEFRERHYDMSHDPEADDFICDKFVIWYEKEEQLIEFKKTSDRYFDCIDRGGTFREFVPHHYSKATGIEFLLTHFALKLEDAYAFGDSNNDLPMLGFVPHSVAMGNAMPESLKERVSYVTTKASEDGIQKALEHFGFFA